MTFLFWYLRPNLDGRLLILDSPPPNMLLLLYSIGFSPSASGWPLPRIPFSLSLCCGDYTLIYLCDICSMAPVTYKTLPSSPLQLSQEEQGQWQQDLSFSTPPLSPPCLSLVTLSPASQTNRPVVGFSPGAPSCLATVTLRHRCISARQWQSACTLAPVDGRSGGYCSCFPPCFYCSHIYLL